MSRYELKKAIKKELRELNWRIDVKILRGLSYRSEARRHKLLRMQLDRLTRTAREGLMGRMAGVMATFML